MRDPTDPLYEPDVFETSSELEVLLGQIRMILFTKQGDIMGSYGFGFNLEDNLFLFNLSQTDIKAKITEQIYTYCPDSKNYDVQVDVQFFQGSVRDVCLVDIYIDQVKRMGILAR